MKIVHIVNKITYTSIPVEWAGKIAKKGNEVIIVSLYDNQLQAEIICKEIAMNCQVIGCAFKTNPIKAMKRIRNILLNNQIDIIHTHHALSGAIARTIAYGKEQIKVVHTVHANHHSFTNGQNLIIGLTLSKTDIVTYNSKETEKSLLNWQKRKLKTKQNIVIYNGIDIERIEKASNEYAKKLFSEHKIKEDDSVLLQVGRLESVKNPIATITAFQMFCHQYPEIASHVKLIFVGDGSEKPNICKLISDDIKDKVILTGTIERDMVYSLMKASDVLIVPSLYEGFCNALFEGLAAGLKLAVSNIRVFEELLTDELPIHFFNANNIDEMKERILESICCKQSVEDQESVKRYVYNTFEINQCIEKYIDIYDSLLSEEYR